MRLLRLLPLLLATPAMGADFETTTIANWTIEEIFDSCVAYNRPSVEIADAPVNLLAISRQKDGTTALIVSFWPGAVGSDGFDIELAFAGKVIRTVADSKLDYHSLRIGVLSDEILALLRTDYPEDATMIATALNTNSSLTFALSPIAEVMTTLDTCAAAMD